MRLDPAGRLIDLMPLPLTMIAAPDESAIVTLSSGYFAQGVTIIDRRTGTVRQELPQTSAFVGLAFAPDGQSFWSSGGNEDVVYQYRWQQGRATLMDSVMLGAPRPPLDATNRPSGTHYPAGLALSPDGRHLYVAENLADSLAVIDVASHAVRRVAVGAYPYAVAVAPTGTVYVSLWGSDHLRVFTPGASAEQPLTSAGRIPAGRHPSAMVLNARGSRIFVTSGSTDQVTVIDTRTRRILTALHDAPPSGPREGSTPNALALAPGGDRLYVAEGDNNALAVFALDSMTADLGSATDARAVPRGGDRLLGRVPSGWYPSAVLALADSVYVANGKGLGTRANPGGPGPRSSAQRQREGPTARPDRPFPDSTYTWGQLRGSVMVLATSALTDDAMAPFSTRVAHANGWDAPAGSRQSVQRAAYPPIAHVVYIIKENRTFDQVFGDLVQADADSTLVFFGRAVSPNHHALAERFGIYDRFFVNAESSPDGHNWSMAAYTTDYLQKTVPSNYSRRGRSYDYEGTNRGAIPDDDVAEPANGYLWNLVQAKGLTFRNYGEFVIPENARGPLPAGYRGNKPFLAAHTHPTFPGYNLDIPDQQRADVWIAELQEFVRRGAFPALSIVRLPNDHTAGARLGAPSPRAFMADNDLALGRMIDALSHTPFWSSTAVFVVEDDSQNGPDHVDSHRSPFLLISPWARGGVHRRFTNTTDVLATIEELLGLGAMSQFDYFGRPLRDVWRTAPDLRPFAALQPSVSLRERNTAQNTHPADARASARLALEIEDQAEEDLFNRVLWRTIRGSTVPYPGIRRVPMQALRQAEAAR
jgi:YVTN family beta-propeller protein